MLYLHRRIICLQKERKRLHASVEYPGNLWTAQNVNQTDKGIEATKLNLQNGDIYVTQYTEGSSIKYTSGFNTDSDSDAD